MIHTLASKAQLKLYHQLTSPFKKKCVYNCKDLGKVNETDRKTFFPNLNDGEINTLNKIQIKGTLYIKNTILLINCELSFPIFGIAEQIFIDNYENIYFFYTELKTLNFNEHMFAYEVLHQHQTVPKLILYDMLHDQLPCLLKYLGGKKFVPTKYLS
jgi:hypothetical protein